MISPLRPAESLDRTSFLRAWSATIAAFSDDTSPERRSLDPRLVATSRLSPAGLDAALRCILAGVAESVAARLWDGADPALAGGFDLVVLPSNIPGLALQPLLRSLAAGRAVLLKSPSAEPLFAPAFVDALLRRAPGLAASIEVRAWRGGDRTIEDPVLARADRVIAYGDATTIGDLARRAPGKVWAHGPKTSLALVAAGADLAAAGEAISRDVALFDQRGCLSVAAIYVEGSALEAERLAASLARALGRRAAEWPPGSFWPQEAVPVQQLRLTAQLAATPSFLLDPIGAGTVLVAAGASFEASPGLRTVRVHSVASLMDCAAALAAWRGRLQGVAIAGELPGSLLEVLDNVGVSRIAAAGELQWVDAGWDDAARTPTPP